MKARLAALAAALALAVGAVGCGDDDATTSSADVTQVSDTPSTDRDREQDRDQIRNAISEIAAACEADPDRLRDRVRDELRDPLQDRLRDQSCLFDGTEELEIDDSDIEVEGDTATARVTVHRRIRGEDQAQHLTWRFRWTEQDGWVLDDLEPLFEDS